MVKPILYYAEFSPAARSVLHTLQLLKVEVELRLFDYARKENITEEFINPRHTVPTLIDDGEVLYDCHAICTYLVAKYAKDDWLYPQDLVLRAKTDQRLYFDASVLTPLLKSMVTPIIYNRAVGIPQDVLRQTQSIYEQMETYLVRQHIVNDRMTVADIVCASTMFTIEYLVPVEALLYPRLHIWLQLMAKEPQYEEVHFAGAKMLYAGLKKYIEQNVRRKEEAERPVLVQGRFLRRQVVVNDDE